ncbi:MAG TPA: hypothetical protein DDY14_03810 [Chromatiaceae bacterium]|jgi:hypothetical protein|nr:MAG: hypothetical protein N838_22565 [Thiohalocapsa sp. PB-PSB1]QQO56025.1 MAG: hypothetical protein N838_24415 [Thiohalocapsa sp. PB-PSB1]HBG94453.1 hypothetical protein [Chromatiaceae bacterium]
MPVMIRTLQIDVYSLQIRTPNCLYQLSIIKSAINNDEVRNNLEAVDTLEVVVAQNAAIYSRPRSSACSISSDSSGAVAAAAQARVWSFIN